MNKAELISLIAAIGTFLGLIPAYHQFMQGKRNKQKKIDKSQIDTKDQKDNQKPEEPMSSFFKALSCVAMAAVFLVIELVFFSWVAAFFGVNVDINTMPFNWRVGFFCLFLVPGILLLISMAHFTSNMED